MNRRSLILGILATAAAPAIARSGVLMPVRPVWVPIDTLEAECRTLIDGCFFGIADVVRAYAVPPHLILPKKALAGWNASLLHNEMSRAIGDICERMANG